MSQNRSCATCRSWLGCAISPVGRSVAGLIASISGFSDFRFFENPKIQKSKIKKSKIAKFEKVFRAIDRSRESISFKIVAENFLTSTCHRVARVGAAVRLMALSPVSIIHQLLVHPPDLGHILTALPRELEGKTAYAR